MAEAAVSEIDQATAGRYGYCLGTDDMALGFMASEVMAPAWPHFADISFCFIASVSIAACFVQSAFAAFFIGSAAIMESAAKAPLPAASARVRASVLTRVFIVVSSLARPFGRGARSPDGGAVSGRIGRRGAMRLQVRQRSRR
jgi:hypothetical protein